MTKENKYTLPIGTKRYRVEYCDAKELEVLAKTEGWQDGESFWDYFDPISNPATKAKTFSSKQAAVVFAKKIASSDVFGEPSIEELVLEEKRYGRDRIRDWECPVYWYLQDGKLEEAA